MPLPIDLLPSLLCRLTRAWLAEVSRALCVSVPSTAKKDLQVERAREGLLAFAGAQVASPVKAGRDAVDSRIAEVIREVTLRIAGPPTFCHSAQQPFEQLFSFARIDIEKHPND